MKNALLSLIASLALLSSSTDAATIVEFTVNTTISGEAASFTFRLDPLYTGLSTSDSNQNEWESANTSFYTSITGSGITGSITGSFNNYFVNTGTGSDSYILSNSEVAGLSLNGSPLTAIDWDFLAGGIPFTYGSSTDLTTYFSAYEGHFTPGTGGSVIYFVFEEGSPLQIEVESLDIGVIPEPGTMILTGLSGMLLFAYGVRRRKSLA